ncbi:MAG: ABC transporter substrate-binding protein [Proteobacteria bacterium]|nr:ABC transporter substrate-binding protein [Pseudomonadota bacterium]
MTHITRLLAASLLAASLLAVVMAPSPARAGATAEQAARAVAETLVHDSYVAMTAADLDASARFARLTGVVAAAFAFDIWERFLVGDRGLTPAQLDEFRALLPGFLARLYADRFGKGLDAEPEVSGTRSVRRDVMVAAAIPRANGKSLPVEYRVRAFAGRGPLVIDIMVGGISFLVLKRDEFKGLIDSRGIDGLLAYMREKAT